MSDNGLCYIAETYTNLMKEYAVNHITSSPHYRQSNGLAEKFVQIVKNLFYKAKDQGTDIYKCLMICPSTPLESTSKSLMQMLQLGIAAEQTTANKNQHLPLHDLHIGQEVMY